jgi:methionyl-tRNA synthetase
MENKYFYITTTLPYVNADPHVGFALEIIRADVIARTKKLQGFEVFFNTGTDEHGSKVYLKAQEASKDPKAYADQFAEKFRGLSLALGLSEDIHFVRTTDEHHLNAAQEFWKLCEKNGDIYKKNYSIKYCVGCELEKTESELENGKCILHPHLELEIIEEENYFFRWSKYQKPLLELYEKNPKLVIPDFRFNEIKKFVERGLEDFSISRLKSKMPWGVEVPGDPEHVMYVWFDALTNYISTLGWPEDMENFNKFWINGTPIQYAGKDNLRQQSAMWQAMLLSAGLPNTHTIVINGFINSGGQKMSKSLGNVINPYDVVAEYSTDALRYYVTRELSPFEDSDMTMEKFKDAYNANLANGLGNLVSRVMKMASDNLESAPEIPEWEDFSEYFAFFETFEINKAADFIWGKISEMDEFIQKNEPFKLIKTDKEAGERMISELVVRLYSIARMLNPILPETSAKIKALIKENRSPSEPLFARKD